MTNEEKAKRITKKLENAGIFGNTGFKRLGEPEESVSDQALEIIKKELEAIETEENSPPQPASSWPQQEPGIDY